MTLRSRRVPCFAVRLTFTIVLIGKGLFAMETSRANEPVKDPGYLRNYAQTRGFQLGRPVRPAFTPDGKKVVYLRSEARSPKLSLWEYDVGTGANVQLVTPQSLWEGEESLTPEEKARRERQRLSAGGFATFRISEDGKSILLPLSGRLFLFDREQKIASPLKTSGPGVVDPQLSPLSSHVAYVRDHDLYVLEIATQKETRLTSDGSPVRSNGLAEFVAQEEMARFSGFWWAGDGRHLVYQQTDHHGVEERFVHDPISPESAPNRFFYPRPGKANAKVKIGIVSVAGGQTTWLEWDAKKHPYVVSVRWPKNGPLLLTLQTRDQKELTVFRHEPKSNTLMPLISERSADWVNIRQETPRWMPKEKGFLWVTEKDGRPALELRNPEGRFSRVVVRGEEGYRDIVSVSADGTSIVYAAGQNPTETHLYQLQMNNGFADPVRLTEEPGSYAAVYSRDHQASVRISSRSGAMPRTTVHKADGSLAGELPSVAENPKFAPDVSIEEVRGDERIYFAGVVRPRDFDAKKRYPVLVDVYGGPKHQRVLNSGTRWLLAQWYADQGFIVVSVDGRGTPGRGTAWEAAIRGKFGSVPLDDQVDGLKALFAKYPYMDRNRVGISGWSFGGYMSALAVMRRPDVFHAGVAGAPVCDWFDYDSHYTERYLGVPAGEDDEAYRGSSLLTYAPNLERPLLILHGTADDNVYFQHSLKLGSTLFRHGKHFEMLPLPGLTHMVPDPVVMERLHSRIVTFLKRSLPER